MAEAFNSRQNHIVSDSAAQINAGDDLSTVDGDDSVIGKEAPNDNHSRRRRGDDEEGTEMYEDDDMESLISQPMNGANEKPAQLQDEDVELPEYACA